MPKQQIDKNNQMDALFKKMIKDTILEEGYFKEKDVKKLTESILKEIDLLISRQIKKHFHEIGRYIAEKNTPDKSSHIIKPEIVNTGDKKNA